MSLRKVDLDDGRMFNANAHVLGVTVTEDRPMRVRRGRILAARGALAYRHEQQDLDDDLRRRVEEHGWASVGEEEFRSSAKQRVDIELGGTVALTGNLKVHRVTGTGQVWLGHQGGDVSIFELVDESVVVLSQAEVLAHDDTLAIALEDVVPWQMATVRDTTYAWVMRGTGLLATATAGEVIVVDVSDDDPVVVEAEALLAYTSGVVLTAPADFTRRATVRGIKWLLQYVPKVNLKSPRERIWLTAGGTGTVVIRSSD